MKNTTKPQNEVATFLHCASPFITVDQASVLAKECYQIFDNTTFGGKAEKPEINIDNALFFVQEFLDKNFAIFDEKAKRNLEGLAKNSLLFEFYETGRIQAFSSYNEHEEPIKGSYLMVDGLKFEFGFAEEEDIDYFDPDDDYDPDPDYRSFSHSK